MIKMAVPAALVLTCVISSQQAHVMGRYGAEWHMS